MIQIMSDAPDNRPEVLISRKEYYEDFKVRLQIHNREFTEFVVEVGMPTSTTNSVNSLL